MSVKQFERLPTNVTPKHYAVSITTIDFERYTFKGQLTVKVLVNEATKVIKLNVGQVVVSDVVFEKDKQIVKANSLSLHFGQEIVTISFESPLEVGEGQIKLNFNGNLHQRMKGFYRCKQADGSYGASTHFEPTCARMAFPCWDEPSLKATFDISLRVPENKTALSNMDVKNVNSDQIGFKTYHFNTTPLMSTYLVAFVVGDYDFVEDKVPDKDLTVRVYTPTGKKEQGRFALKVAKECLGLYNEYFGIAYPLKKCDLIAISDFPIGAMENWGLVTFREARLLCDPQNTSSATKQNIKLVIGHELAHMWFGNLVTMYWWTDLWLKEGFAEFIMYMSVGQLYPDMQTWSTFVADILGPALELDALHSSHPIEVEVGHPSEVEQIFDSITYYKGASIIRMLHSFIGAENFKKGLQHYLRQYQFGNATTMNLWESFETVSDQNVGKVMSTWTKQKGFPVIEVVQRRLPAEKRVVLDISQKKFSMSELTAEDSKAIWSIPITVCTRREPTEKMVCLLDGRNMEVTIENVDADDWVKVNANSVGYYHVLYESSHLSELLPAVESKALSPLDRWNLQNDLFALVQAGRTSTVDVLKLMKSFVNEDDYTVWAAVDNALERLDILLANTDDQELLHAFGREILQNVYANVGWNASPKESHTRALLRSLVIRRLGTFGDENVTNAALKHFDAHVNGSSVLAADLRSAVYRTVIHSKRKHIFDALMKLFREADLHEEKNRIFGALGCVDDQTQIERVLQFALSNEVRPQDTHFVLGSLASSMKGRNAVWAHFRACYLEYRRRYDGSVGFGDIVKLVTQNFASDSKATEIEQFFDKNRIPGTERSVKQAVETIRIQAKWLNRDLESIRKYLS
ncbi:puromycin-sensitive aminopeptidase-like [Bradysia coprophila]|uniref:puromycin-sensitive aminopeptidase-like n=1 Tax=Bradysia coprophila TaxID=38358 RepID=UPI00187DB98F|nr:puromycin-sensitive aminopeptidase-like [Bradysia coprophila]